MFTRYVLPLAALGLLIFAIVQVMGAAKPQPQLRPPVEPARSPFAGAVAGSGMVEAQTENISIGTPVPGLVVDVAVKVGQYVKAGAELYRLDDRPLRAELRLREAAVAAAQADLKRLEMQPRPEMLPVSAAAVAEAEADVTEQEDQLRRITNVRETSRMAKSEEELVMRQQQLRASKARLEAAKAQHALVVAGAWEYDKLVAQAAVDKAQAQVEQTKIDLDRLIVRTLVDGQVLQVNVRPGEFVAAPSTEKLIILGNVQQLHVRVDIDEFDIPRFDTHSAAQAMLKGWPDNKYNLHFVRIEPYVVPKKSLTGQNTERVDTRVLQVIYAIDTSDKSLYVGQQMDVYIEPQKGADGTTEVPTGSAANTD